MITMSTKTKLTQSRDNWKGKAVKYGKNRRYLKKENNRIKNEKNKLKSEVKRLNDEFCRLEALQPGERLPEIQKVALVFISLQLFLVARISFRAVHRVLNVAGGYLGFPKAHCPQTIINWVTRLSLTRIQNVTSQIVPQSNGRTFFNDMIFIIDTCIGLGSGKILAVLALNKNHYVLHEGAPTLQQVQCVGVAVAESWTGEKIAGFLESIIECVGIPEAYLKDQGTDLSQGGEAFERTWVL